MAEEFEPNAVDDRRRVRLNFANLLLLAHANRPVKRVVAAGSVPPELQALWDKMEGGGGVEVEQCYRHELYGEQQLPDKILQVEMLHDAIEHRGSPGIMVLLSGDGAGYLQRKGFQVTLERVLSMGWGVELLAWRNNCNGWLQRWIMNHGLFIPLDEFYFSVTFLEASKTRPALARSFSTFRVFVLCTSVLFI